MPKHDRSTTVPTPAASDGQRGLTTQKAVQQEHTQALFGDHMTENFRTFVTKVPALYEAECGKVFPDLSEAASPSPLRAIYAALELLQEDSPDSAPIGQLVSMALFFLTLAGLETGIHPLLLALSFPRVEEFIGAAQRAVKSCEEERQAD